MTPDWLMATAYVNELCGSFRKIRLQTADTISFYLNEDEYKAGIRAATTRYLNCAHDATGHGVSGLVTYRIHVGTGQRIEFVFCYGRSSLNGEPFESFYIELEDTNAET